MKKLFHIAMELENGKTLHSEIIAESETSALNKARRLIPRTIRASTKFNSFLSENIQL